MDFLAHERTQVSQNVHACMHTIDGQDTKALTQLPSLPPQTSLDQAEKLCASLESDSQADLLKACLGLLVFATLFETCLDMLNLMNKFNIRHSPTNSSRKKTDPSS